MSFVPDKDNSFYGNKQTNHIVFVWEIINKLLNPETKIQQKMFSVCISREPILEELFC